MGSEGENVKKLIPAFEQRNPGIRVKVQQIPWTAAHEKLLTAFAGNSMPDVCALGNTWIPEFAMLNSLEDLNPWLENSSLINKENYFPGIWETNVIDTSIFGIPWYVDTRLLYYRKDIFEKAGYSRPPRTWDEWYDVSVKIKKLAGNKEQYAILLPTNEWAPFVIAGLQSGSSLLREENRFGDFRGHEFTHSFEFLMKFYQENLAPVGITQVTNIYQGISEGFFAMYITGPWNIGEFRRRLPENLQDTWMTAPLPGPQGAQSGISLAGGSSLVLFRGSNHKAEAWKLIEYLSEAEQQLEFYAVTGDLPAVRDAWKDSALADNIYTRAFYEQLQRVVPTPKIPEWERIAMKVQQYAEAASARTMSVEGALTALDRDVDGILEKYRWMLDRRK
ncbi:MAG: sugar ABC transporter substrate-binding protein [Ignavibacteriales bacterium]|nr:sugar ABC transporter substrate-binding protein [Ignavibacteriales bacterium]